MEQTSSNTSQTQSGGMTSKQQDLVTKYLADMIGLEGHVYQAIDKQVKETQDEPDVNPKLREFRDILEQHVNSLRTRLDALGGQATSPIKEAGASVLGIAAGLIDKIRSEEVSKNFRDNYTALSLSVISYEMLITTCLACNDNETAELATRYLKDNTRFVMDIGNMMPSLVVRDLGDKANLNQNAVQDAQQRYKASWQ